MIIDASVAFKWIAPEPSSDLALGLIGAQTLVAPLLLLSEVANALRKKARRVEIRDESQLAQSVATIGRILELRDEREDVPSAFSLAGELDHSVYDCVYLAMAIRFGDILLTADAKFARKVSDSRHHEHISVLP